MWYNSHTPLVKLNLSKIAESKIVSNKKWRFIFCQKKVKVEGWHQLQFPVPLLRACNHLLSRLHIEIMTSSYGDSSPKPQRQYKLSTLVVKILSLSRDREVETSCQDHNFKNFWWRRDILSRVPRRSLLFLHLRVSLNAFHLSTFAILSKFVIW